MFHSVGAAKEKERLPCVFECLIGGYSRRMVLLDLSIRYVCLTLMSSVMYSGARQWIALKVIIRILKMKRNFTGSQCRSRRRG